MIILNDNRKCMSGKESIWFLEFVIFLLLILGFLFGRFKFDSFDGNVNIIIIIIICVISI